MNNVVKIILNSNRDGSNSELHIDFKLYQSSYKNKLIDIYVPKSMLYEDEQDSLVNTVKTGALLTAPNGDRIKTRGYYADYMRDEVLNGVEYAVYEQNMPNTFTLYAGTQEIVANVVNIDTNNYVEDTTVTEETTGIYYTRSSERPYVYTQVILPTQYVEGTVYYKKEPKIIEVVTTQKSNLVVYESAYLDEDIVIEPTDLEIIYGRLDQAEDDIDDLQTRMSAAEDNIDTLEDDVADLDARVTQNTTDIRNAETRIANAEGRITVNEQDIAYLKENMSTGEYFVTQLTGSTLPTDAELTATVVEIEERQPKSGDVITFIQEISGETDKVWKYTYQSTGWKGYEIQNVETGSNTDKGVVQGNYGSADSTQISVIGGVIKNVYVKDANNNLTDIRTYINSNKASIDELDSEVSTLQGDVSSLDGRLTNVESDIEDIEDGTITVGRASRATSDGNGDNIANTYLKIQDGVSKQYVKDYALSKNFNDIYYISQDGYSTAVPTTPADGKQFTVTSSSVGDVEIFQEVWNNEFITQGVTNYFEFELAKKNSYANNVYIKSSINADLYFRLTTEYQVDGTNWETANVEVTNVVSLIANTITKVEFSDSFNSLGDDVVKFSQGGKIRQTLELVSESSTAITLDVYSSATYPTTFNLNTQSLVVRISTGLLGEQPRLIANGELLNNLVTCEFGVNSEFNNNTEALITLNIPEDEDLLDTTELIGAFDDQTIRFVTPFNMESGNPTLEQLKQLPYIYNSEDGYTFLFKGFIINDGASIRILFDMLNQESGITEIVLTGTSGTLTDDEFNKLQENPNAIVFSLNGRKFIHNEDATSYVSYSNTVYPTTTTQETKVIYVNTTSSAANYKSWSVEDEYPGGSVITTDDIEDGNTNAVSSNGVYDALKFEVFWNEQI